MALDARPAPGRHPSCFGKAPGDVPQTWRGQVEGGTLRLAAEEGSCGCGLDVRYQLTWTAP
jgi:hypothetical protein